MQHSLILANETIMPQIMYNYNSKFEYLYKKCYLCKYIYIIGRAI